MHEWHVVGSGWKELKALLIDQTQVNMIPFIHFIFLLNIDTDLKRVKDEIIALFWRVE